MCLLADSKPPTHTLSCAVYPLPRPACWHRPYSFTWDVSGRSYPAVVLFCSAFLLFPTSLMSVSSESRHFIWFTVETYRQMCKCRVYVVVGCHSWVTPPFFHAAGKNPSPFPFSYRSSHKHRHCLLQLVAIETFLQQTCALDIRVHAHCLAF